MPHGAELEEVLCLPWGDWIATIFHALEVIQCMAERRCGGETGVTVLQALRDNAVWKAIEAGKWEAGGWSGQLFDACLCRSQTLAQPETFSHRFPTVRQMRRWVKDPVAYRFEYADGLKATMFLVQRPGWGFHLRRPCERAVRANFHLVLLAPEPKRGLFRRAHVQGRRNVHDRKSSIFN